MKFSYLYFIIILASCAEKAKVSTVAIQAPKNTSSSKTEELAEEEDSTYITGDFLFTGSKNLKFDYITNGSIHPKLKSKGDTLYHDKQVTILGDFSAVTGPGVYKKYTPKFSFDMFQVDEVYNGKPAGPNFSSDPDAKYFKTRIKEGCKSKGVNFAGHYTIIEWGCGMLVKWLQ
jgi:hypothetical protein